jgi:hypothetical protein
VKRVKQTKQAGEEESKVMTVNNLPSHSPGPDDDAGFRAMFNNGRLIKGTLIGWNDIKHWADHDGGTVPSPMLVIKTKEVLQRWQDNLPEVIDSDPLPDPDELNAAIPVEEWEMGLDDKPRPPWAHTIVVYFINPATAEFYTYTAATYGGHVAFGHLSDAIVAMGMISGSPAMPLVNLAEKPFKTKRGMKTRPHFEIKDWKTPGGSAALPPAPPPLQLAPAAAPSPAERIPVAETPPPAGRTPGKITVSSGKPAGKKTLKGAVYSELENRRPDLKPVFDDNLDDLPTFNK